MAQERTAFDNLSCETEAAFNTRNGVPALADVQAFDVSHTATSEPLDDQTMRTTLGQYKRILGKKRNTLDFSTYAVGLQTPAGDGVLPSGAGATTHGPLLTSMWGAEDIADEGALIDNPGGTATVPIIDDTGNFTANSIIGVDLGTGSTADIEWRPVLSVAPAASDSLTLALGLSAAPTAADVVYATAWYLWSDKLATATSVQFRQIFEGTATKDTELYGCTGSSLTLSRAEPGALGVLNWSYTGGAWDKETYSNDPTTPTPFTKSPWMDSQALIWPANEVAAVSYSATYARQLRSCELTVNRNPQDHPDPNSTEAINGYDYPGDGTHTGNVVLDRENPATDWTNDWEAGTALAMMLTFGRLAGRTWGVYYPKLYIVGDPTFGDDGGIMTTEFSWEIAADRTLEPIAFQG